jgi:transcription elongation factor GreA
VNTKTTYISKDGLAKLRAELGEMLNVRRPEIAQRIHDAKEHGDLSENAEYEDAKNEQAFVEGRILTIETILANAVLIESKGPSNEIRLGSKVTITEVATGEKDHYVIVGSAEADPADGKISNESPMGKALLGHKTHEVVMVQTPDGPTKYKISHISNK